MTIAANVPLTQNQPEGSSSVASILPSDRIGEQSSPTKTNCLRTRRAKNSAQAKDVSVRAFTTSLPSPEVFRVNRVFEVPSTDC